MIIETVRDLMDALAVQDPDLRVRVLIEKRLPDGDVAVVAHHIDSLKRFAFSYLNLELHDPSEP
jgi:hypothetical protein